MIPKKARRNCGTNTSDLRSVQSLGDGGGGCSLVWPTQGCAAGQGMVFYLPPRPPRDDDMLEMTTDAQEGNNKTLQGNTMQSHRVVMRLGITMIF